MKPTNRLKDQKGMALVVALIMLLVLTLIGLSAVNMSTYETNIAGNERVYNLAFYTADGGIENFRGRVSAGEFIYSPLDTGSYQVAIGGNNCNVTYSKKVVYSPGGGGSTAILTVSSWGTSSSLPTAGRVRIDSIIEASMMTHEGYN